MADEEFKFGNTDRPEAVIDLEDLISSGYMDYGLEARLWDEFAPEFGAFDPNSPEFQAAMDELIASGVANISTAGAGTTKDIVDAILGTIDVTDGVSQEDINAAIAVLDSGLVTIDDVAKAVGLPADVVSAAYEANKPAVDDGEVWVDEVDEGLRSPIFPFLEYPTVDDSAGEWYDPDTGLVIPNFDPTTGEGMGTLFPTFVPDSDAGGGSEAAAEAAAQTAAEKALSGISAEGGFSEAEANEVYDLLEAGTVTLNDVSRILDVPQAVVTAGYEQIKAAQTAAEKALSGISAEGGFSEAEANEVYDLLEANTVTVNDVSTILNVPEAVVTAGYNQIKAERAAPEEIVDLTADTTASTIDSGELDFEGKAKDPLADYKLNPELYTYDYVSAQLFEMIANETNAELRDGLIEEYEGLSGQAYDPNKPIQPIKKSDSQIQEEAAAAKIENAARAEAAEKEAAWGNVDKDLPLDQIVQAVINIFGTGNEGVAKVIDIANQRGSTAGDIATAAGISIEDVNAAAKTAGVTINTTPDDAAADDATGCPEGSGKIDDGAGNCVCPEGFSENDSGVCETDTDILDVINTITGAVTDETNDTDLTEIVTGGGCTGGKIDDGFGNCVCPEGEVEIDGVCQAAGGGGGCTGGKVDDGAGNCVCPEGKVEDANGVCQAAGGGGACTGGRTRDPITDECVCPQGTEDVNGQCVGTGSGECPEGQTRDIFGNCVAPEPETTQAVPDLFSVVQTKPGEKVGAIDFYDISGPSIFRSGAKTEEEEDPLGYLYSNYSEGGIVQDYDIEELIRFLENQRG
jgi:hypothetical protein